MGAIFTVDLEDWNHGLHISDKAHSSISSVYWLEYKLAQYKVKAIFYTLKAFSDEIPGMVLALESEGHIIKTHGFYHYRGEIADRNPYAWLGFTGGFYFRLFPYWLTKRQVIKNEHFYIHPHDLDEDHPQLKNPFLNWKRHVGLKTARIKLERLLKEIEWSNPNG